MHSSESKKCNEQATDDQLIEQIQSRETNWKDLFGQLVERHQASLFGRCITYLRNPDDAADASQETLLRAYRGIDSFKGESTFRTWLFAIADNQCHTLARKRSKLIVDEHIRNMVQVQQEIREEADGVEPAQDVLECVHSALARIAPTGRDVLQLRYFSGLSIEDIAVTLGVGISAAKMRLYRAQDQIAGLIDQRQLSRAA